jgi:hypothetical protein
MDSRMSCDLTLEVFVCTVGLLLSLGVFHLCVVRVRFFGSSHCSKCCHDLFHKSWVYLFIVLSLAIGLSPLSFGRLGSRDMPTLLPFKRQSSLLWWGQTIIFSSCVIAVFNGHVHIIVCSIHLPCHLGTWGLGLESSNCNFSCVVGIGLRDEVLKKVDTLIKTIPEISIRKNLGLDMVEYLGFDACQKMSNLGAFIKPCVSMFLQTIKYGVLIHMHPHIPLKVPPASLATVTNCL